MIKKISNKIIDKYIFLENINTYNNILISFLNPVSYNIVRKQSSIYNNIDYFCFDGFLSLSLYNFFFKKNLIRTSFDMTSLAPDLFEYTIKHNKTIFFIGSKENEINKFIYILINKYKNIKIVGYRHGYFSNDNEKNLTQKNICQLNPDFVIVGMGCVLQEQFLVELRQTDWSGIGITCGGFIHQTTNNLNYYPKFINNLNLRMPYRLLKENLYSRLYHYPFFIYNFIKDRYL